jgi:hypothetical protein
MWQRLRTKITPDRIVEVTVVGGVDDITDLVIERHLVSGAGRWISLPLV